MEKKHIIVLATGGTIAGSGEEGKTDQYRAGKMDAQDLLQDLPSLEDIAEITTKEIASLDSNDITVEHWLILCDTINELAKQRKVDGFVVTHGTDTLEETAYFLNLTIKTKKPVVITGAMRPATAASADGPLNLYQAIALAASREAYGQGVIAVFSDNIYSAREIQKVNNLRTDAFNQKDFSCLGYMKDENVYFFAKTFKRHSIDSIFYVDIKTKLPNVTIASYYVGADPGILDYLAQYSQGIVIAGTGSGNYSQIWIKKVEELNQRGIIIVRSSRVSGLILENDVMDSSKITVPSNTLSPQKARVLLMLALSLTTDIQEIKEIFEQY